MFRIYDNCLASGIEAIFAFSIVLLRKNEDVLLTLNFDDILTFLKMRVFEPYTVSNYKYVSASHRTQSPINFVVDRIYNS